MIDPLDTLYTALNNRLSGQSVWDDRVFPDVAPARAIRPLVVFNLVTGGDSNRLHHRTPGYLVDVKCITSGEDNPARAALIGAGAISDLLNDQGAQGGGVVVGDDTWCIVSIVQENRIHIIDDFSEVGRFVYYSGHTFRIEMEEVK